MNLKPGNDICPLCKGDGPLLADMDGAENNEVDAFLMNEQPDEIQSQACAGCKGSGQVLVMGLKHHGSRVLRSDFQGEGKRYLDYYLGCAP